MSRKRVVSQFCFRNAGTNTKNFGNGSALPFEDDRCNLNSGDQTILVIEDDIEFAKIVFDLAHEMKFKCIIGQGADEGYEMANQYLPRAIFLDMKLPDHLGLTVLDRLKESPKTRHIPVQVISIVDYAKASLQMGAIGFLKKPVKREEIKDAFKYLETKITQKTSRILVSGTDENRCKAIDALVGDENSEIVQVRTGLEAISQLKEKLFDCVVIDVTSSIESSLELLELMSSEKNGISTYTHSFF